MKKIKLAAILFISFLLTGSLNIYSQDETTENTSLSLGGDLVNRYVWRGMNVGGSSVHVQTNLAWEVKQTGLSVGAWGSYGLSNNYNEIDLFLSYVHSSGLSLTINDYFVQAEGLASMQYLEWDDQLTAHTLEAVIGFEGTETVPFHAHFAMNLYGADARNIDGDIVYSKYLELGYVHNFGTVSFDSFIGISLDKPDFGVGYYTQEKIGIINLGFTLSKEIKVSSDFSLPIYTSFVVNPETENVFLVLGISF